MPILNQAVDLVEKIRDLLYFIDDDPITWFKRVKFPV
jgi:hypothetical protein